MFDTVEIPVWLFVLILLFAAVTAASHLFIPPVRWFFRRRMERAVDRMNERLERPIQPFKLARRHDMILRLIYDPKVTEAVAAHARETGMREDVAFSEARRYAREIVPSFSATAYFSIAIRAARWLSTMLFHVRLGAVDDAALAAIDRDATVVFVMNHRSNMDYVLVTYLAAERSALSYAVGEWAQIWPLSRLFRAMGAYFIRRRSRNTLYRRVLARYVQMAVAGGVTQAMFPEGGLSLDGHVGEAKLGLLSYIAQAHDPTGRDVVFVPVSLNYDRVIEDRILVEADRTGVRRFRGSFLGGTAFALRWGWRRITGKVDRFGIAAVSFGEPLSIRAFATATGTDMGRLGERLMRQIRRNVPIVPMPLVSWALVQGARCREDIIRLVSDRVDRARRASVPVHLTGDDLGRTVDAALDMLILRRMVSRTDGRLVVADAAGGLLAYYAASVEDSDAAMQEAQHGEPLAAT